ncbi:unnamed protein product, partial [Mesorhabditis spiculigera]
MSEYAFGWSYNMHAALSMGLHMAGVFFGLFVWHLFPKHPTRFITMPAERVALLMEPPMVEQSLKIPINNNRQLG